MPSNKPPKILLETDLPSTAEAEPATPEPVVTISPEGIVNETDGDAAAAARSTRTFPDWSAAMRLPAPAAVDGGRLAAAAEVPRIWGRFFERQMRRSVDGVSELLGCRTITDAAGVNARVARETVGDFIDANREAASQTLRAVTGLSAQRQ